MLSDTMTTLERTAALMAQYRPWFDTLADWYQHTNWTRRAIEERLRGVRAVGRLAVAVNGLPLEGVSEVTDARASRVTWLLPSNLLRRGENEVAVRVDQKAPTSLAVAAASFEQDYHLGWQTASLAEHEPRPAPNLALAFWKECSYTGSYWSVEPGGLLQFRLLLPQPGPVNFTLHLGAGRAGIWLALLHDLGDKLREAVSDAVKEKLWQVAEDAAREWFANDPRAQALRADLQALSVYLRLDQLQLRAVFAGPLDGTLEDVIARTGWPSPPSPVPILAPSPPPDVRPMLVEPAPRPVLVEPAPRPRTPVEPVHYVESVTPNPPQPRTLRPPVRPGTDGGGATVGKLIVLLALAGGGWYLYNNGTLANWWNQITALAQQSGNGRGQELRNRLQARGAQVGEVQVSLFWNNKNDLDLHVISPFKLPDGKDEEVFFGTARKPANSPSGGQLDVDANVGDLRDDPVENIHWPQGKAPRGTYKVYVVLFSKRSLPGCADPTRFTVRVVVRGQERILEGTVSSNQPRVLVHEFRVD
jgi:hypothetical protein